MLNWFYNWLDPKILRIEKWVNQKVVGAKYLDVDLDKIKKGEIRDNPPINTISMALTRTGNGPFLTNLQGADIKDFLIGLDPMQSFGLLDLQGTLWWRHRDGGVTEDFMYPAFKDMQEFFISVTGKDNDKYWSCVLRTKAINDGDN